MQTTPGNRKTTIGLIIFFTYLAALTLNPFEFSLASLNHWLRQSAADNAAEFFQFKLSDFILNILLFLPFGAILYARFTRNGTPFNRQKLLRGLLYGALVSLLVELLQIFLTRTTSCGDILANSLGTVLGLIIFDRLRGGDPDRRNPNIIRLGVLFLTGFYIFFHLVPAQLSHFLNWDDSYTLLIGDELHDSRPWEGEISLAAVYNRTLSKTEAAALHSEGVTSDRLGTRRQLDCIALYDFTKRDDGFIPDLIAGDNNLPLYAEQDIQFTEDSSAVIITTGNAFRSRDSSFKIVDGVQQTRQLSVEVRIRTARSDQTGPARIITLSGGKDNRNFTLGQVGSSINFRVRTPLTGRNGSLVALTSPPLLTAGNDIHLVATCNSGIERLYVNGSPVKAGIFGVSHYLPLLAHYNQNLFSRYMLLMLVFFPIPCIYVLIAKRKNWIPAGVLALLTAASSQVFYMISCGQTIDYLYWIAVISGLAFGLISGLNMKTETD